RSKVHQEQGEANAQIFDAHLLLLEDPELIASIEEKITAEKINAEAALHDATSDFIELFEQMENEYMRERAADIKDVTKRVLAHLLEKPLPNIGLIQEETIIIAENLSPSETAQINKRHIKGFVTDAGGRTSHSAIMARSLQITAIVGTKNASECIENDDDIIIDGAAGEIYINPTETMKEQLKQRQKGLESQMKQWA